ncbi:MAG: two-component system response regulator [Burkholderiaceae bacterium]|nr:two-component system response regulator [Burkholderiaceae bacterium]
MNDLNGAIKHTVLVVDDTPDNLFLMKNLLQSHYRVKLATSGEQALNIAAANSPPDMILLDIMMPGMDGYEVCRQLKHDARTATIPVIFLTSRADIEDEEKGLELGAVDYITKPICPPIVLARVKSHLALKVIDDFLRDQNHQLELEVAKRVLEVTAIQDVTILVLASLAETRDNDTGNHLRRTQFYVKALADKLRDHPRFAAFLTPATIQAIFKSAPLHDIGKVGIPDHILLKPGRLEPHEFEVMKTHTTLGYNAIQQAERALGTPVPFLSFAMDIALSHQEKWDGSGYPQGLAGDAIPIAARLMAVADVYDALICRRVYKAPMPHDSAVKIMREGRGTHFDADVLDAFINSQTEFVAIAERFTDTDADLARLGTASTQST